MQVKKIQHYFAQYRDFLKSQQAQQGLYIWEAQQHFQENWDLDSPDLVHMFDQSLQSNQSRRLWLREAYAPKEMMLEFAKMQDIYFRQMFKDLFQVDKSLEGRVGRFIFYCDECLRIYQEQHPHTLANTHYHNDGYEIISVYLAFRYPDQYTLYKFPLFQSFLEKVNAPKVPLTHDLERYFKISKTLYTLMKREEGLLELHQERLGSFQEQEGNLLVVYDFLCFVDTL